MVTRLITDQDIEALIDDELNQKDQKLILKYLEETPEARKKYKKIYDLNRKIKSAYSK